MLPLIRPTKNQNELAECVLCGHKAHWLGDHLSEVHGENLDHYMMAHPASPTCSAALAAEWDRSKKNVTRKPAPEELSLEFSGVSFPVFSGVPESACLPLPASYKVPKTGPLGQDVESVAIAVRKARSIWVWGPPGTGKDAFFSALCALTRRPSLLFQVVQGADIQAWRFVRSFDANGTKWEEGLLLRALRDGYTTKDGQKIPYLIVLSDFDRANRQQAEELRQILDSIQGRISGPDGTVYPVMPGTIIVATANSSGAGDTTGRCISANPIDASILDRFERKIRFHQMAWADEEEIVKAKFPALIQKAPGALDCIGKAITALREAVAKEEIYAEISHRTVCNWAGAAQDIIEITGKVPANLLKKAARVFLDGLPDDDTRENAKRVMDPHIKGGIVGEGDTSHIKDGSLEAGW